MRSPVSSPPPKNISLSVFPKLMVSCAIPPAAEGRFAIVTTREAGMRWTPFRRARLRETTDDMADGEIVWS